MLKQTFVREEEMLGVPSIANAIDDCAAHLFWRLVERRGRAGVDALVVQTRGKCLVTQSFSEEVVKGVLREHGIGFTTQSLVNAFISHVKECAYSAARKDKTLWGALYVEELSSCRPPTASTIDVSALRRLPRNVRVTNQGVRVESADLWLRHPLPAVVVTDKNPARFGVDAVLIEVNTRKALGFSLPMWLCNEGFVQVTETLYAIGGTFQIPVPTVQHGELWDRAILNSTRVVQGISVCLPGGGQYGATVEWG